MRVCPAPSQIKSYRSIQFDPQIFPFRYSDNVICCRFSYLWYGDWKKRVFMFLFHRRLLVMSLEPCPSSSVLGFALKLSCACLWANKSINWLIKWLRGLRCNLPHSEFKCRPYYRRDRIVAAVYSKINWILSCRSTEHKTHCGKIRKIITINHTCKKRSKNLN